MESHWDTFIGHRGSDATHSFATFLHYALELQGITAFFDDMMVGNTDLSDKSERAMHGATWGIVILTPGFFQSSQCMKDLRFFLARGNVLLVSLGLGVDDYDAFRIVGKAGIWQTQGGELWKECGMEEGDWKSVVEDVAKKVSEESSYKPSEWWGDLIVQVVIDLAGRLGRVVMDDQVGQTPPYVRNLDFVGRERELAELERLLSSSQGPVCISSTGGMGKTELAVEYGYRHREDFFRVLWVDASAEIILPNYLGLAKKLHVSFRNESGRVGATANAWGWDGEVACIRAALERLKVPHIIVFDGVTNFAQLSKLVPRRGECQVMVTSRIEPVSNYPLLHLEPLAPADGFALIRGSPRMGATDSGSDLRALVERFGNLTLALSLCSAWLRACDIQPGEVLRRVEAENPESFQCKPEADAVLKSFPNLIALLQASMEQIQESATGQHVEGVILVGGWFAAGPIRTELLVSAARLSGAHEAPCGAEAIEEAIDVLVKLKLAKRAALAGGQQDTVAPGVVFHAVLRSFGRIRGGPGCAKAMVRSLVECGNVEVDVQHFEHVCDLVKEPPEELGGRFFTERDQKDALDVILLSLMSHYEGDGLFLRARDAVAVVRIDQLSDELVGRFLPAWASCLLHCGQHEEALLLYKRLLDARELALGYEHPLVATVLDSVAVVLQWQGRYEEALPLYQRSMCIRRNGLGPEHPEVAVSLTNVARLRCRQGRYEEALTLYKRALRIRTKALGSEHPDVAVSLSDIAELLRTQGRCEAALPLYERSLHIRERVFGPDDLVVATALNDLASLLQTVGKDEEALRLYERSLRIREEALWPEHPDVAASMNNVALLFLRRGRYRIALGLFERALSVAEDTMGSDHPDLNVYRRNLAYAARQRDERNNCLIL